MGTADNYDIWPVREKRWWIVEEGKQLNMEGDRLGDRGQQERLVVVLVCQCRD